jgi:hypothetical protein
VIAAGFKVTSRPWPRETEKNHGKPQTEQLRFEAVMYLIQVTASSTFLVNDDKRLKDQTQTSLVSTYGESQPRNIAPVVLPTFCAFLKFNNGGKRCIRGCIHKFPDWPPGTRTANGTALCH